MSLDIKTIAVAGAGTMGTGIAQVCAAAGFNTLLFDISADMLQKAKNLIRQNFTMLEQKGKITAEAANLNFSRITFTTDKNAIIADLIIEAIVEDLSVKHAFFNAVALINKTTCILATNTSSIPVTQIASKIPNPERVLGIHFFNPAPVMKLVEIISGAETDAKIAHACKQFIEKIGKTCVLAADSPGFIVNRVARHYYVEGLKLLEEGVADFTTIDALMENCGFKMGPFKLMDLIGVDTNLSVTTSMYNLFNQDGKFRPSRIQQQKVAAGHNGRKSGKGFYSYET